MGDGLWVMGYGGGGATLSGCLPNTCRRKPKGCVCGIWRGDPVRRGILIILQKIGLIKLILGRRINCP